MLDPLDGTKNPTTVKLGDSLEEITGVLTYSFGYYSIYPQTAVKVVASASPATPPPTTLTSSGTCKQLTVGDYNVENLTPKSAWLPSIADHIATYLKTPDLMFIQEIQDDNGATNNGGTFNKPSLSRHVLTFISRHCKLDSHDTCKRNLQHLRSQIRIHRSCPRQPVGWWRARRKHSSSLPLQARYPSSSQTQPRRSPRRKRSSSRPRTQVQPGPYRAFQPSFHSES